MHLWVGVEGYLFRFLYITLPDPLSNRLEGQEGGGESDLVSITEALFHQSQQDI